MIKENQLYASCINLEKAFDRVPMEVLEKMMEKKGISYVLAKQLMGQQTEIIV